MFSKHVSIGAVLFVIGLLSACSSQQASAPIKFDNVAVSTKTAAQWQQAFAKFNQHNSLDDYSEYLDIIRSFDDIPNEQFCLATNIQKLLRALQLNPTSLTATSTLTRCAKQQGKTQLAATLQENAKHIAILIIGDNNGQSSRHAIHVREVDEAFLLLDIAGFDVLASEIEIDKDTFYYKIHSYDRLTRKFRFQYFTNHHFLHAIHKSVISGEFSAKDSLQLTLESYREDHYPPLVVHDVRQKIIAGQLDQAEQLLSAVASQPLLNILKANLALASEQPKVLLSTVDPLLEHQQQGGLEAYLTIIHVLLKYAQTAEEFSQLDEQLASLSMLTSQEAALTFTIGKLMALPNASEQLTSWWRYTENETLLEPIAMHFVPGLSEPNLELPNHFNALKFAAQQNAPSALFVLARYYLERPQLDAKPLGQQLLNQSISLGYEPAIQYQSVIKDKR